jgi:hypothetical protein
MKVAVEIWNGCVQSVYADEPCEVAIVDRDELGEDTLPDGERGYASIWEATVDTGTVRDAFSLASLHHAGGIAGALLRAIQRMRRRRDP